MEKEVKAGLVVAVIIIVLAIGLFLGVFEKKEIQLSPDEGLVAHYKFEGNADDEIGRNNGVLKNGVNCNVPGKLGKACEFDGVDDYVEVGDDDSLDMANNDFTIAAWIKASGDNQVRIINKRKNYVGYEIYINKNRDRSAMFLGYGRTYLTEFNSGEGVKQGELLDCRDETWHHIAVVFDRDGEAKFYVDGIYDGSKDISFLTGSIANNAPLTIGKYGELDIDYFSGALDELRIYNRILSEDEIKKLAGVETPDEGENIAPLGSLIEGENLIIENNGVYEFWFNDTVLYTINKNDASNGLLKIYSNQIGDEAIINDVKVKGGNPSLQSSSAGGDSLNLVYNGFTIKITPIGKTLKIHYSGDKAYTGISFGNIKSDREFYLPYLDLIALFKKNNKFFSFYPDFYKSNAYHINTREIIYEKYSNGSLPSLNEVLYLTVSDDVNDIVPRLPGEKSEERDSLNNKVVLDAWGYFFGEYGNASTDKAVVLQDFHDTLGLDNLAVIFHSWQKNGFDGKMPEHYPADPDLGGSEGMINLINTAKGFGWLFALHENYESLNKNSIYWNDSDLLYKIVKGEIRPILTYSFQSKSYLFDGVDDYIEIPHDDSLDISEKITLSAWVGISDFNAEHLSIIGKSSGGGWVNSDYWLWVMPSTNQTGFYIKNVVDFKASYGWTAGWHHIVATYDGSEVKIYVDGKLIGSEEASGNIQVSNSPIIIGQNSNTYFHKGTIDEIRIYNKALNEEGLFSEYCCEENLVARYTFDGHANDELGKNNGIIHGNPEVVWIGADKAYITSSDKFKKYLNIENQKIPAGYETSAVYHDVLPGLPMSFLVSREVLSYVNLNSEYNENTNTWGKVLLNIQDFLVYFRDSRQGPLLGEGGAFKTFNAGWVDGTEAELRNKQYEDAIPDFELKYVKPKMANHGVGYMSRFFVKWSGKNPAMNHLEEDMDLYRASEILFGHAGFLDSWPWIVNKRINESESLDSQHNQEALAYSRGMKKMYVQEYYLLQQLQNRYLSSEVESIGYWNGNSFVDLNEALKQNLDLYNTRVKINYKNGLVVYVNRKQGTGVTHSSYDFSNQQGYKNWYYGEEGDNLVYNFQLDRWGGVGGFPTIAKQYMTPDTNKDAVLRWKAVKAGDVEVEGYINAPYSQTDYSNGVIVKVMKGDSLVEGCSWDTSTNEKTFYFTCNIDNVDKGEFIKFKISSKDDRTNDNTNHQFIIHYPHDEVDWAVPNTNYILPANGWLATNRIDFTEYSGILSSNLVSPNNHRVDVVISPEYVYVDARGVETTFNFPWAGFPITSDGIVVKKLDVNKRITKTICCEKEKEGWCGSVSGDDVDGCLEHIGTLKAQEEVVDRKVDTERKVIEKISILQRIASWFKNLVS